jgi:hypothetical protein
MAEIFRVPLREWGSAPPSPQLQDEALHALEAGKILFFPELRFSVDAIESLRASTLDAAGKNVSFDISTGRLGGVDAGPEFADRLRAVMERYCTSSRDLLLALLPRYRNGLRAGRTSFRPMEIAGRETSWRKDDTRLHVDSFPSTPVLGERILRVFSNVNPEGEPRLWRTGESFQNVASKFVNELSEPPPGLDLLLAALKITKKRRSAYDHFMLKLHDRMKSDEAYQSNASVSAFDFPAGSTWIVYTDQVAHAAMRGSCAFEQTFYLPVEAMGDPESAPLRVLERLKGRSLTS